MLEETSAAEIEELLPYLTEDEKKTVFDILAADTAMWRPLPGPQSMAYYSKADIIGYGGAAGGGKTDLMCGLALNRHKVSALFRREATQLPGIVERMTELMSGRDGYNGQEKIWRLPDGRRIEFGSCPNPGDETKHQGRPKDLLGLDETANFLEHQARFLMGWVRSVDPAQHCQTLMTFNPPTTVEGRWLIGFYAPWLDDKHPIPAAPGELRYFATVDGEDVECVDEQPFNHNGELITPLSRTFIPSRIADNPFLLKTGYMATLQSMPEPLRSQMLYGDFKAGMTDDPWQVIPTAWVERAMARWKAKDVKPRMDSMGVDVARGGKDKTVIARRHEWWFDEPLSYPGRETVDGPYVAGLVISANRDHAPVHIDVIGVGSSPYDFLKHANQQVMGVNVAEASIATDKSGRLRFRNLRSQYWWQFREMLDPNANNGVALPPSKDLLRELCSATWTVKGDEIYVSSREEIYKQLHYSPDLASAYILAMIETPRMSDLTTGLPATARRNYDPFKRR